MKKTMMPYMAKTLSSDTLLFIKRWASEYKRRVCKQDHVLDIFIKVDDPYSFLLIQVLPDLIFRFNITPRFHTILNIQKDMMPIPSMWHKNAVCDSKYLASLYNIKFENIDSSIDSKVNSKVVKSITAQLLILEESSDYLSNAKRLLSEFWENKSVDNQSISNSAIINNVAPDIKDYEIECRLAENENLLRHLGHYSSAMIHYGGEWYWGIDRLDHLERRLINLGCAHNSSQSVKFGRTYQDFCQLDMNLYSKPINVDPIVFYWSARSPYSYIALERIIELVSYYRWPLEIKPVMPMVMRGLPVPNAKKMYIFFDTKREAKKLGVNYGFVADPLGKAVEYCYALMDYAKRENKLNEFLLSFARAVNSEGIHADTLSGLKKIVVRSGLDWNIAEQYLNQTDWKSWVEKNLSEMMDIGFWGVPCFQYKDLHFWGQDRIKFIEQAIVSDLQKFKVE